MLGKTYLFDDSQVSNLQFCTKKHTQTAPAATSGFHTSRIFSILNLGESLKVGRLWPSEKEVRIDLVIQPSSSWIYLRWLEKMKIYSPHGPHGGFSWWFTMGGSVKDHLKQTKIISLLVGHASAKIYFLFFKPYIPPGQH